MGSIRNKKNWNNASKHLFGSYSHSGIPGFHSGYSAPRSRIAGIYSGIHSYSGIFPNECALISHIVRMINVRCPFQLKYGLLQVQFSLAGSARELTGKSREVFLTFIQNIPCYEDFFGNFIFAIFARLFCGNHRKLRSI